MVTPAQRSRYEAIQAITGPSYASAGRDIIVRDIRDLESMGRTARWLRAVNCWANEVEHAPEDHLAVAILQGAIHAAHAAS